MASSPHMFNYAKNLLLFCLLAVLNTACAQVSHIGGVINSYAGVTVLNFCTNQATVTSTAGFQPGQRVLIIQMKGAQIATANSSGYGAVTDYKSCGNHEINTIESITGSTIKFKYAIQRDYDDAGAIQLVSLEEYGTAATDSTLRAKPWDGSSGGVLLLKADTLILSDSVDARGKGFRGGALNNETTCANGGVGGGTDYVCSSAICGGRKGEGIGTGPGDFARGKNGNGGGGGNDHNTGGGGGSNYGAGGIGGTRSNVSNFSCPGPGPGQGGMALVYDTAAKKVFMGGGGGAGDENNNQGTAGGNGGGICIIMARLLISNDVKINANGDDLRIKAQSDGAGAGGGGGAVLLYVDNYLGNLEVDVNGGRGGVLDNGGDYQFCFGPGGGGGGGVVWFKGNTLPGFINVVDTGGINGRNIFGLNPPNCPTGTTNGAQRGSNGGRLGLLQITEATIPFVPLTLTACCDTMVCPGATVFMNASGTATYPPALGWSNGITTNAFTQAVNSTQNFIATVTDYRGCTLADTLTALVPDVSVSISANPDTAVILGTVVQLVAHSDSAYQYHWSPGDGLSDADIYNPVAQPAQSTTYCVTVTNTTNCTAADCKAIEIALPDIKIPDAFTPNGDGANDEFIIFRGNYAEIKSIKIYNRWGELVFNVNTNIAWDGTYKGKVQEAGAYVCYVTYGSQLTPGKTQQIVKNIFLIR